MKKLIVLAVGLGMLAPMAPLAASAQHFGPPAGTYQRGMLYGQIRNLTRGAVTMDNGRTVFLKPNTVINGRLAVGRRIQVQGSPAGGGNVNANTITVIHRRY